MTKHLSINKVANGRVTEVESDGKIYKIVDEVDGLIYDLVAQLSYSGFMNDRITVEEAIKIITRGFNGFNQSRSLTPFSAKDMVEFTAWKDRIYYKLDQNAYILRYSDSDTTSLTAGKRFTYKELLDLYIAYITPKIGDTILCEVDEVAGTAKIIS